MQASVPRPKPAGCMQASHKIFRADLRTLVLESWHADVMVSKYVTARSC